MDDPGRSSGHRFLRWPGPIPFAHRGGASDAPENTLPAFARAVELGYTYLETDVHLTADGVVVAFHDDRLDRVTDRRGAIAELTWAEVREARVGGSEPIVRLDELLEAFPDARVNIDPKHDAVVDPLARVLLGRGAVERVCIGAFSDRRIEALVARCGPDLCTSMGPRQVARLVSASTGLPLRGPRRDSAGATAQGWAPCAQVPTHQGPVPLVTPRLLRTAHRLGIAVHVWTVDDPVEMDRLLDMGVDGIMTDQPAVLRAVLERRGQWHVADGTQTR